MKIKNKALLKRRVKRNLEEDKLTDSTYAYQEDPGEKAAVVCGIGCLGLPHTVKARRAAFKQYDEVCRVELTDNLCSEFGICPSLSTLLEAIFVGMLEGGKDEAGEFLRKFAAAIPEGQSVTSVNVEAFCNRAGVVTKRIEQNYPLCPLDVTWPNSYEDARSVANVLYRWFEGGARVSALA